MDRTLILQAGEEQFQIASRVLCKKKTPKTLRGIKAEMRDVSVSDCFHFTTIRLCLVSQEILSMIKFHS